MKTIGRDLTEGSIPRHLLSLAIPMLIGNLLNTGYSIIDAMWIGRMVGREAIGAIAVSFPVVFLFVGVANGATLATTILVSQFFGAKNHTMVRRTVGTSFSLALILGVVSAAAGIMLSGSILKWLGTPESIMPLASSYLKIAFLGFPVMYLSFLVTSILRGVGDTRTPLYFMAAGVVINAVLDPLFIIGIGPLPRMGLDGAAWASIISAFAAVLLGTLYLNSKGSDFAFNPAKLSADKKVARLIFSIGLPSMIQQSAVSLGMVFIASFVNKFGAVAAAAYGAAGRIDSVAFLPAMSIGLSVSAITGQNLGAGKVDRVHSIFKWGLLMTASISLFLSIFFLSIPDLLLSIFTTDQEVIAIGRNYLRIVGPSTLFFAIMYVSNGVINGAGHTLTTLAFTICVLWGVRIPMAAFLSRTFLGIEGIWIAFAVGFFTIMCVSLSWYFSGRWKKPVVRAGLKNAIAAEPASAEA